MILDPVITVSAGVCVTVKQSATAATANSSSRTTVVQKQRRCTIHVHLDHPLLKGFTRFRVNVRRLAVITGGGGTVRRRLRALTRRRKGRGDGYRLHRAQLGD